MSDTPVSRLATLADLEPTIVNVEVELEDGEYIVFRLRMPTFFEILKCERAVRLPDAPINGVDKQGRPIRNPNDPGYQTEVAEVLTRRNMLQLAGAIIDLPIPGDTPEAKAEWLMENMPARIMRQLSAEFQAVIRGGEARIEDRAHTFHRNGNSGASSDEGTGADAGAVG